MMLHYFEQLAQGIQAKLEQEPAPYVARKKLALEVARLGMRLYSEEQTVAWCGLSAPFDLLQAMGVTSCFVEFVGAMLASTDAAGAQLDTAEQHGYSTDMCSYHRSVMGAAINRMMPEPAFLVATSCPCSAGQSTIENLARWFKKDLLVIHVPQRDDPAAVDYLADQLRSMTDFVAAHTGRPLDSAELKAAIVKTNAARQMMLEVFKLVRSVPSPARRRDMVNFAFIMLLLFGTDEAVELARAYRDEFADKVRSKDPGVPGERIRLLWFQNRIQFRQRLEEMLEDEFQAAVVVDELNDITFDPIDPEDPYRGLARRTLSIPLNGTVARRIEHLQRLIQDYQVDGVICPGHWGCRQGTGARGLIEMGLRKFGVPVLNLEVDCVDPRNFSEGQLRTRLQAFIETILERKAAAS